MAKRNPDFYRVKEDGRFWGTKFQTKDTAEKFARERRSLMTGMGKKGIGIYGIRVKKKR